MSDFRPWFLAAVAVIVLAALAWFLCPVPVAPAPAPAAVSAMAAPAVPERAPRKKPKVVVRRPAAEQDAPAVGDPDAPEVLAYGDLSDAEKTALSVGTNVIHDAVSVACLAPGMARAGASAPVTVELEVSTTADGLHELEVVHDGDLDAEAIGCLEELAWRLRWPRLQGEGVIVQSATLTVDPGVGAQSVEAVVARADGILGAVLPAEAAE